MILGLDLSVNSTGYYFIRSTGEEASGRLAVPEKLKTTDNHFYRLAWLEEHLLGLLCKCDGLHTVVLEDYSYNSKGSSTYAIAEWGGIARLLLHKRQITTYGVSPYALKAFACPDMKATEVKKEHILLNVFKRWGRDITQNDIADAFVLAAMGMELIGSWEPRPGDWHGRKLIENQKKALAKVLTLVQGPIRVPKRNR